ncbi:hypothetical protein H5410_029256 [Solanum commersonii]|uniref:RRM domain-containing protein n=1 Tax=Solanum commersonii TaxID=4109 RepID=A0A9J5Z8H0_SOLCO|nr:hypothetical protein H5410_029256 [Solanum commersonii]
MSTVTLSQYNYLNGTYFPTPFHLQQQPSQPYIGSTPSPIAPPVVPPVFSAPAAVPDVYSLHQYLQFPVSKPMGKENSSLKYLSRATTQQLFQRVAQTITPEAIKNVKAALASRAIEQKAEAAGQTWEDPTLAEWPENDFRLFCGNLGNEVNDDVLSKAFSRFPSFNMARVVRDKQTGIVSTLLLLHEYNRHLKWHSLIFEDHQTGMVKRFGLTEECYLQTPPPMREDLQDDPAPQQLGASLQNGYVCCHSYSTGSILSTELSLLDSLSDKGSMWGTGQFSFGRVSGKTGLTMKLWQDRSFLLNVVAESVSKEERIAQVTAKLIEYSLICFYASAADIAAKRSPGGELLGNSGSRSLVFGTPCYLQSHS